MIPEFPNFKPLELSDRGEIEEITSKFPPYSDFNFTSLWSWDTEGTTLVSKFNEVLILKLDHYTLDLRVCTFFPPSFDDNILNHIKSYLSYDSEFHLISLIPEFAIQKIQNEKIICIEEDHNHDYIYYVDDLIYFKGSKLRGKKNFINRFNKTYAYEVKVLKSFDDVIKSEILELSKNWFLERNILDFLNEKEYKAIQRFFQINTKNLFIIAIYINNKLAGFTLNEIINSNYAILHFEKAISSFVGIYPKLMQETCIYLKKLSILKINYEQDLGIPGLKSAKKSYQPMEFLKKYQIVFN